MLTLFYFSIYFILVHVCGAYLVEIESCLCLGFSRCFKRICTENVTSVYFHFINIFHTVHKVGDRSRFSFENGVAA